MKNNVKFAWALFVIGLLSCAVMLLGLFLIEEWSIIYTLALVAVAMIAVLWGSLMTIGVSIGADLGEKDLRVTGPLLDVRIPFEKINDVKLRSDVDYGVRLAGYAGPNIVGGNFTNKEFGRYKVGAYLSTPKLIVISHGGSTVAFNLDSLAGTEQLYENLMSRVRRNPAEGIGPA